MRLPPLAANAPAVLVVDEGFIGSLQAAVGLRRAGWRVVLLGAVGGHSRYRGDGFDAETGPLPHDARFVDHVREARRRFACDVVYATTEPAMLALDGAVESLHPRMSERQRGLLFDKRAMSSFAAAHGLRVPREIPLRHGGDDLADAMRALGTPMVLKTERGRGGDGTAIVQSLEPARAFVARAAAAGRVAYAQQLVRGSTWLAGGLFHRGEPLRLYAGEKVRQQPDRTGPAILIRSAREPALIGALVALMRALGWTGLASTDFVRDASGEFLFLEVNPRPWGSIAAAKQAGVDLYGPLAAMLEGGEPEPSLDYEVGVHTHVLPLYLLHRAYRRPDTLARRLAADLRSEQGAPFRDAALLRHILYRLWRVKRNWRGVS